MSRVVNRRPSPALVVSLLALFVALGRTGHAAIKLPKNSVGTTQLKAKSVTAAKVKPGSLLASNFKANQLPRGAQGLPGVAGPKGDVGAKGATGAQGVPGPQGPL